MATILVTGAGRGIGLQLLKEFLTQGHEVIATVRDKSGNSNILELAKELKKEVEIFELEVTDPESVSCIKKNLQGRKIDILINNAGVLGGDKQGIANFDFDEWAKTFSVNTIAPVRIAVELLPNIKLSDKPKIVTVSSIMGAMSRERGDSIAYRSSKAAVNKAMQCLALELKDEGIGVYLIHPGWVNTDMGGANADVTVEDSARGIAKMVLNFTMNDTAKFWQYDGQELEW